MFSLPNTDCRYVAGVNQAQKRKCVVVNKRTAVAMERLCIYLENNLKKNRALIGLKFYQVIRLQAWHFYRLTVYDLSSYHFSEFAIVVKKNATKTR